MKDIGKKLRYIYFRYFLIAISTVIIYTFFRWLLDIELGILHLKEDVLDYWIPIALPIIPILLWLRKGIRILNIKGRQDNGYFLYQFFAALSISVPTIIAQEYIKLSSLKLIEIESVNQILKADKTTCFSIKEFYVINKYAGLYRTSRTSGRNNEDLNFTNYFVVPIVDKSFHLDTQSHKYWYGFKFTERMDNHASDKAKDERWKLFYQKSMKDFELYNFHDFQYLKVLGYSDDKDGYMEAIQNRQRGIDEKSIIVFEPEKKPFEERMGKKLPWILGSFGIGSFIFFLMVLVPTINVTEFKKFVGNKPLKDDDFKDFVKFLIPRGEHFTTALLIDINLIIFVILVLNGLNIMSPTPKELLNLGANRRYEVVNGEYWRLLTSVFLHGGLMHIMMNAVGIGITCVSVEPILGKWRTLVAYILSGIGGSLLSIYWHENTISVGASGAIFGMMGVMLALLLTKQDRGFSGFYYIILGLFGGVNLLLGLLGGIDNAAHLGGLISGFLIGLLLIFANWRKLTKANSVYK